jgi:hypothetical protein
MSLKKILAISSSILLLLVSACSPQAGAGGPSQNATAAMQTQVSWMVASTFAAQTVLADIPGATQVSQATSTPEFTFTPSLSATPSLSPMPSPSPTPTITLTPTVPMVSVSKETNCRTGPGTAYVDVLGILHPGETAEVVGRSVSSDFWIIKLPAKPGTTCWLWGNYATVTGNTSGLTIFEPPPTPTPRATATPQASFDIAFFSIEDCGGGEWGIKFQIINSGSVTFDSNRVTVTDQATSVTKTINRNTFPELVSTGCAVISEPANLDPGEIGYTSSDVFATNPAGHAMKATIRVCSSNGMLGTCGEKTITFTP